MGSAPAPRGDRPVEVADLREMQRAADQPDGLERLLRWLAYRVDGWVALLDRFGHPGYAFPRFPAELVERAGGDITRVRTRKAHAAVVDLDDQVLHVLAVDNERPGPVLVVSPGRPAGGATGLIGDALRLVRMRWQVETASRQYRAVAAADQRVREAVLHLLMTGSFDSADRAAGALRPELPDPLRVYVVECGDVSRDEVAAHCDTVGQGATWVIRCPVYERHLILLAPAAESVASREQPRGSASAAPRIREGLRELTEEHADVRVGESLSLELRDIGRAYEQAFHALAASGQGETRWATFNPRVDLALLLGRAGHAWARATLAPLVEFVPERRQDPAGADLLQTLRAWLDFPGRAARQLKIHRNTVAARLRRVEGLLGRDLGDLATLARLHLAIRVLDYHPRAVLAHGEATTELAELLDAADVRSWADDLLAPVLDPGAEPMGTTLRTWLAHDTHLERSAAALGVSVAGVRKRLRRIEEILGRSLLNGPSARYDLLLALGVHDRHLPRAAPPRVA